MPRIHKGVVVRLINDIVGDLPKRYIGRKGVVQRRATMLEMHASKVGYVVKFKGRKEPLYLYLNEIRVVKYQNWLS